MTALAAGSNVGLLEAQAREFKPSLVSLWDQEKAKELALRLADTDTRVLGGMEGLLAVATEEKAELLASLELFYKVFFLNEEIEHA